MQPTVVVGADWTLHPWRHNSSNVGSVTACQARQNSSNVGGVTAGQVKHNSSNNNDNKTSMALKSSGTRAQKRNKTTSLIIFKSRGHRGVIISLRGR